jgi:hypothetical protein
MTTKGLYRWNGTTYTRMGVNKTAPPPPPPPSGFFYANKNPTLVGPQLGPGIMQGGTGYTQVGGLQTDTTFTVSADNMVYEGLEIWGIVENGTHVNTKFRNCILHGFLTRGTLNAAVHSSGDNHRGLVLENCLLEGRGHLGVDTTGHWGPVGRQLSNEWCGGLRGGNYTLSYCELRTWPDFLALTGYGLGTTAADGTQNYGINVTVDHTWMHDGWFMEWTSAEGSNTRADGGPISRYYPAAPSNADQSNLYTHVDGIQFSRGKNFYMGYSYVGGLSSRVYQHNVVPSAVNAINNSCDDMYNSCGLIKQEYGGKGPLLENIVIEFNCFEGSQAGLNIVTSSATIINQNNAAGVPNNFPTTFVRNNRSVRGDSQQFYYLNGPGLGNYSNNIMDDTELPAKISPGF